MTQSLRACAWAPLCVLHILAAFAELERELIRAITYLTFLACAATLGGWRHRPGLLLFRAPGWFGP
jgi:hypothetical protein